MPLTRVATTILATVVALSGLTACGPGNQPTPDTTATNPQIPTPDTTPSTPTTPPHPTTTPSGTPTNSPQGQPQAGAHEIPSRGGVIFAATGQGPLTGKKIAIDPGHNGKRHKVLSSQVPAGNGKKKNCNTTGTQDPTGYTEHALNWDVSQRLIPLLSAAGAEVIVTRPNDNGVGPCVNERAAIPNRHNVDLLVSIHADGSKSATARGFHIIISTTMVGGQPTQQASKQAATTMVTALEQGTGLPRSTYIGKGTGLSPRRDIAGLNLLTVPGIMIEMGNVHHPQDGAFLRDPAARDKMATALLDGIVNAVS